MSFDLPTLIAVVGLPAVIALLAATVAWRLDRSTLGMGESASAPPFRVAWMVVAAGWWLAPAIGLAASEPLPFWSDDGWPRTVWTMLLSVFVIAPFWTSASRTSPTIWTALGCLAVANAALAIPVGDAWTDVLPLHRPWILAMTIAASCNALALDSMARRGAHRWVPLVILAGLACPAISGAAGYSALFETCLAAIVATLVIAIFAALGLTFAGPAIVFPSVLFMATMVAASRFYSYADVPPSAYGIAMFAPTLISLVDRAVANWASGVRIAVAAMAGAAIVAVTAYQFLLS